MSGRYILTDYVESALALPNQLTSHFIRRLRSLEFRGFFSGARHQFMVYGTHRLTVPSNAEYSVPQLKLMLREVEAITGRQLSQDEWDALA